MFELGNVTASAKAYELINKGTLNVDVVLKRHLQLEDDTNGEDRTINEYTLQKGFGSIINIYNIENQRVYVHTVKEFEGKTYTRIYLSGEY